MWCAFPGVCDLQQRHLEQRLHKAETLLAELTVRKQGKKRLYHAELLAPRKTSCGVSG